MAKLTSVKVTKCQNAPNPEGVSKNRHNRKYFGIYLFFFVICVQLCVECQSLNQDINFTSDCLFSIFD